MCQQLDYFKAMMACTYFILLTLCAPILGMPQGNNTTEMNCENSDDCSSGKVCVDLKCEDPCLGGCGLNTVCHTVDKIAMCDCKPGFTGYPFDGCYPEECTMNSDCPEEMECRNKHCEDACKKACGLNSHCKGIKHRPVCSCSPGYDWNPFLGCQVQKNKECSEDSDCLSNHTCSNFMCVDPCGSVCGNNTICTVENHHTACACRPGFVGNPFQNCVGQDTIKPNKTYVIQRESLNWFSANERCRSKGMQLASIMSATEQADVERAYIASGINSFMWLSGSDWSSKGHYVWSSTGKSFVYTNWRTGEPEVSDSYRCIVFRSDTYTWQTGGCSSELYYICEQFKN